MCKHQEPTITINGENLTIAQVMTVRVAISFFSTSLKLEDSTVGKQTANAHLDRLKEISTMLIASNRITKTVKIPRKKDGK